MSQPRRPERSMHLRQLDSSVRRGGVSPVAQPNHSQKSFRAPRNEMTRFAVGAEE